MNRIESDCHDTRLRQPTYKMKFLVLLAIAVACASADVLTENAAATILRTSAESSPEGSSFRYAYETSNNINNEAQGVVKNFNSDTPTLEITGNFGYIAPDGTPVRTSYIANEGGYVAQGSHIPVAPEVPELIARALAYIAAHPPAVEKKF